MSSKWKMQNQQFYQEKKMAESYLFALHKQCGSHWFEISGSEISLLR